MASLKEEVLRIRNTFMWSLEGWLDTWKGEKSLRQWTGVNVLSILLSLGVDMETAERALI